MVLLLKYLCFKLNSIFSSKKPKFMESGVTEPTWVKLKRDLCSSPSDGKHLDEPEGRPALPKRPGPSEPKPVELRPPLRIMEDVMAGTSSSGELPFPPDSGWIPGNAAEFYSELQRRMSETDDVYNGRWDLNHTFLAYEQNGSQIEPLGLIRENPEPDEKDETDPLSETDQDDGSVTDRFLREPKLSRAGSVDYGLNYATDRRSKMKRRRDKGFSYSDPEDKNISISSEIEPLLPIKTEVENGDRKRKGRSGVKQDGEKVAIPVEGEVRVLMRKKPTSRATTSKHNNIEDLEKQQQQGSGSTNPKELGYKLNSSVAINLTLNRFVNPLTRHVSQLYHSQRRLYQRPGAAVRVRQQVASRRVNGRAETNYPSIRSP